MVAVEAGDAGGFLAAVLERVEAERDEARRALGAPDSEDAALLAQLVVVERVGRQHELARIHLEGLMRRPISACHRICRLPHEAKLEAWCGDALPDPRLRPARSPPAPRRSPPRRASRPAVSPAAGATPVHRRDGGAQRAGFIVYGEGDANCSASGRIEQAGAGWALVPTGDAECRIPLQRRRRWRLARRRAGGLRLLLRTGGELRRQGASAQRPSRQAGHRPRRRSALLTFTET